MNSLIFIVTQASTYWVWCYFGNYIIKFLSRRFANCEDKFAFRDFFVIFSTFRLSDTKLRHLNMITWYRQYNGIFYENFCVFVIHIFIADRVCTSMRFSASQLVGIVFAIILINFQISIRLENSLFYCRSVFLIRCEGANRSQAEILRNIW